jgi:alkylation response protein AidB-like acyl-CoA dehydrogenase
VALPLYRFGSPEQRQRYLRDVVCHDVVGALAHTEPRGAGLSQIATGARRRAGGYVLDGRKSFVSHAARCDFMLTTARTGDGTQPLRELSLFLVDRLHGGFRGSESVFWDRSQISP